jgi:hypothetical protein
MEYLVERYLPDVSQDEVAAIAARAHAASEAMAAEGVAVRYLGATLLPDEEACFCRFEAPSAATVEEANCRAALPFARVTAARQIALDLSERSQA